MNYSIHIGVIFLFQGHSFKCRNDRYLTKNGEHFSKTEKNVQSGSNSSGQKGCKWKTDGKEKKTPRHNGNGFPWMTFKKAGKNFNRREMLGNLVRKQLERTSGNKHTQQISRYHAQNMSNIVTLRLQRRVTNKTSEIPPGVGVMEWIHGNILIEESAVRKRPVGRRWSSTVGCDNNSQRNS